MKRFSHPTRGTTVAVGQAVPDNQRQRTSLPKIVRHSLTYGRSAYTLVELLVAIALALLLLAFVVQIFGLVGNSVTNARALLEMNDRLRWTAERLRKDLQGATAEMTPPLSPEAGEGYFEYIEGPLGPVTAVETVARNTNDSANIVADTTVIDKDDILMFTTRLEHAEQSGADSALIEVSWFVRGTTLYRRVLWIDPSQTGVGYSSTLSKHYDVNSSGSPIWVANTLADLTKRENRFAHQPGIYGTPPADWADYLQKAFPFHPQAQLNSGTLAASDWRYLGLPTLRECSATPAWSPNPSLPIVNLTPTGGFALGQFDAWNDPLPFAEVDQSTGTLIAYLSSTRVAEDVILTNVIGFDVKAWDPGAPVVEVGGTALVPGDPGYTTAGTAVAYGAYVDLGYDTSYSGTPAPWFSGTGNTSSGLSRVYDTWSNHYEKNGVNEDGDDLTDEGANGFDDDGDGIVDGAGEQEAPPPYAVPLRGIQIRIRTFDPDTRQVRDWTIVQDFLPE